MGHNFKIMSETVGLSQTHVPGGAENGFNLTGTRPLLPLPPKPSSICFAKGPLYQDILFFRKKQLFKTLTGRELKLRN